MRILYKFQIPLTKIVEKKVEKDIEGKKVTVIEKVDETESITYLIKRPTRDDYSEAEFFHDKNYSHDFRNGILTRSELIKRFSNEDVIIKKVYNDYADKENNLQRLILQEKTEENIAKRSKLEQELLSILTEIQNFELNKSSAFEHTCENRARNKTVFWWILNLSYKLEENKEIPLFEGKTFEEKIENYDRLLETEDTHLQEVIQKYFYFIPVWYSGQITKEEDFKKAEDLLNSQIRKDKEDIEKQNKEKELENQEKREWHDYPDEQFKKDQEKLKKEQEANIKEKESLNKISTEEPVFPENMVLTESSTAPKLDESLNGILIDKKE